MVTIGKSIKKIGATIQARTSSTRLPKKVLLSLPYNSNVSVLENIIIRIKKTDLIHDIIVATTYNKDDDIIEAMSSKIDVKCFRGEEDNVLSRIYFASEKYNLDIVLCLTGDNPCIDHNLINLIIDYHIKEGNDYTVTKDYPLGTNLEVCSFEALKKAYQNAREDHEKEHVTSYFYKSRPQDFKISIIRANTNLKRPDLRLTLDTEEDYALLCAVYDYLYPTNNFFTLEDIVKLFEKKPWLRLINKRIIQKKIFNSLQEEIEEAIKILDLQDLDRAKNYIEGVIKYGEKI